MLVVVMIVIVSRVDVSQIAVFGVHSLRSMPRPYEHGSVISPAAILDFVCRVHDSLSVCSCLVTRWEDVHLVIHSRSRVLLSDIAVSRGLSRRRRRRRRERRGLGCDKDRYHQR